MRTFAGVIACGLMAIASPAEAAVVIDQISAVPYSSSSAFGSFPVGLAGIFFPTPNGPPTLQQYWAGLLQTVTAGSAGLLDHFDFRVMPTGASGTLIISLVDGDYLTGARTVVGQTLIPFSSVPQAPALNYGGMPFLTFDTSGFNYAVVPGQKYSLLFEGSDDSTGSIELLTGSVDRDAATGISTVNVSNYSGGSLVSGTQARGFGSVSYLSPLNDPNNPPQRLLPDLDFRSYVNTIAAPPSGAVPEPATWAMLIVGLGAIGGTMRRRGKKARRNLVIG